METTEQVVSHPTTDVKRSTVCISDHNRARTAARAEALSSMGNTDRSYKSELRKQQKAIDIALAAGDEAEVERYLALADKAGITTGY